MVSIVIFIFFTFSSGHFTAMILWLIFNLLLYHRFSHWYMHPKIISLKTSFLFVVFYFYCDHCINSAIPESICPSRIFFPWYNLFHISFVKIWSISSSWYIPLMELHNILPYPLPVPCYISITRHATACTYFFFLNSLKNGKKQLPSFLSPWNHCRGISTQVNIRRYSRSVFNFGSIAWNVRASDKCSVIY